MRAQAARDAHEAAKAQLAARVEADRAGRDRRREADRALVESARHQSQTDADRSIADGRLGSALQARDRHREEALAARARLSEAEAALRALGDLGAARAEIEEIKMTVEAARMTMMTRRSALDELRRAGEGRARRLKTIAGDRTNWLRRLESAGGRVADLEKRAAMTDTELEAATARPVALEAERDRLRVALEAAEGRAGKASDAVAEAEAAERTAAMDARDAERAAGAARETRAAAQARAEAAREAAVAAAERARDEQGQPPQLLAERLEEVELRQAPAEVEAKIVRLRSQRDALGAVNLRAEEDAIAVREERDALAAEKADLEQAIGALRQGISGLNREGRERLLTAFEQVNANFSTLFTHLFGGGEARLALVESDDPLEAGLEIMCQPPGKRLSVLSLLSGGEQTLTALALIFAVFLANPAPICVLDEVDAPLDDANVTRFCDLLDEMTRRTATRFLIITHHAVTMARMDRLFGVTMAEQGVSQLVSVDLRRAEAMVA